MDNEIKILERGDTLSYIEHTASKRTLWIPNIYIQDDIRCHEYTDYLIPVSAGDMLFLEEQKLSGYLVKKDGVYGWYLGELEEST